MSRSLFFFFLFSNPNNLTYIYNHKIMFVIPQNTAGFKGTGQKGSWWFSNFCGKDHLWMCEFNTAYLNLMLGNHGN